MKILECQCNEIGSLSNECDETGKCHCKARFAGHLCDQCSPGHYRYPECIGKFLAMHNVYFKELVL